MRARIQSFWSIVQLQAVSASSDFRFVSDGNSHRVNNTIYCLIVINSYQGHRWGPHRRSGDSSFLTVAEKVSLQLYTSDEQYSALGLLASWCGPQDKKTSVRRVGRGFLHQKMSPFHSGHHEESSRGVLQWSQLCKMPLLLRGGAHKLFFYGPLCHSRCSFKVNGPTGKEQQQ